jgi:hypothetical protein
MGLVIGKVELLRKTGPEGKDAVDEGLSNFANARLSYEEGKESRSVDVSVDM